MLYHAALVSAVHQHERAVGMHHPSVWSLLPPPTPLPGWSQSAGLSSLRRAANPPWRSIFHMVMDMFQCYSLNSSHSDVLTSVFIFIFIFLCLCSFLNS